MSALPYRHEASAINDEQNSETVSARHAEASREAVQGQVKSISRSRCDTVLVAIPKEAMDAMSQDFGPTGRRPLPSPLLTPLENMCMESAQSRMEPSNNQFPGLLPDGARATYLGNGGWEINY